MRDKDTLYLPKAVFDAWNAELFAWLDRQIERSEERERRWIAQDERRLWRGRNGPESHLRLSR
jgi:hypothetical protein